jgi:hypothetical protein
VSADPHDPDRAEWEALHELRETGAEVDDALGALLDRRGAADAHFRSLVGPLLADAGVVVSVVYASDDPAERDRRLDAAPVLRVDVGR